jgi:hypothetical protein
MMFDLGLFNFAGIPLKPDEMRPLSEDEIRSYQISNLAKAQQAKPDVNYWNLMSNYAAFNAEKPLDERFADFKLRLAAAIDKRRQ